MTRNLAQVASIFVTFTEQSPSQTLALPLNNPRLRAVWVNDLTNEEAREYLAKKLSSRNMTGAIPTNEYEFIFQALGTRPLDLNELVDDLPRCSSRDHIEKKVKAARRELERAMDRLQSYPALIQVFLDNESVELSLVRKILGNEEIVFALMDRDRLFTYNPVLGTFQFRKGVLRYAAKEMSKDRKKIEFEQNPKK